MDAAPAVDEPPEAREDISTASMEHMDPAILHEYLQQHGKRVPQLYHYVHTAKRNWPGRFTDEDTCAICLESLNSGYTPNYTSLAKALSNIEEEAIDPDITAVDGSRCHIVLDWFHRLDPTASDTDVNGDGNDDPFPLIPHIGLVSRANEPRFLHPTFTDDRILTCAFGHAYHRRCLLAEITSPRSEDRMLQDRCPQCRRRLFADVTRIQARLRRYEFRRALALATGWVKAGDFWLPVNGVMLHPETGEELFRLLRHEQYDRGVAAWKEARDAFLEGEVGRFSTAMDEAERIDDELQAEEQRLEDDTEDDTEDEATLPDGDD
ncbi:hypothetical protein BFW01_g621 [Lasiodiplodia theobromae]|nr:hypothetical protein BFW01_g621 [Lasiodiplodia theobromae]